MRIQYIKSKVRRFFAEQPIVERAWLFGSYSRGEETSDSDIDILVQYNKNERVSLFTISRLTCALQKLLNKRVDLVESDALLPFAIDSVQHDKLLIYERAN